MRVAILGTGKVGQTLAEKFHSLGYEVIMGTREVKATLGRSNNGSTFTEWHSNNNQIILKTFIEAVNQCEIIVNALNGAHTISALQSCNVTDFDNKIVIDVANPLDLSNGFPPTLIEGLNNNNSLGETIQSLLPKANVVKTLNTMWCGLMVNPKLINNGQHQNYICGNNIHAKEKVIEILMEFGWSKDNILDLGGISNARGTEAILLIWTRIFKATQNGAFNMQIVK